MDAREAERAGDRAAIVEWLQRFGRAAGARDAEVGRWLLAALRTRAFHLQGAASIYEMAERLLGWEPRTTYERVRVARALEELPKTAAKLEAGELHWTKVRELTRVATPETEEEWLERAATCSVRRLEALVAGRRPGDRPTDPPDPRLIRETVRLALDAEGLAIWRQACDLVRRRVDPRLGEEGAILHLLRLGMACLQDEPNEAETGGAQRPAFQTALTLCVACKQGFLAAQGESIPVRAEVTERAICDSECVGFVDEEAEQLARAHVGREGLPPEVARHLEGSARTTRGIPPKIARQVRLRDRDACQVPGCRQRLFTEIHHIEMRMDGGAHDPRNLLVLCGTHHQLLHDGRLWIEGRAPDELVFRHADGTIYGTSLRPRELEENHRAFTRMREAGIREKEVRRLLPQARASLRKRDALTSSEELVRTAMALHASSPRSALIRSSG